MSISPTCSSRYQVSSSLCPPASSSFSSRTAPSLASAPPRHASSHILPRRLCLLVWLPPRLSGVVFSLQSLLAPDRTLVKEGALTLVREKRSSTVHFLLFNDLLAVAEEEKQEGSKRLGIRVYSGSARGPVLSSPSVLYALLTRVPLFSASWCQ